MTLRSVSTAADGSVYISGSTLSLDRHLKNGGYDAFEQI